MKKKKRCEMIGKAEALVMREIDKGIKAFAEQLGGKLSFILFVEANDQCFVIPATREYNRFARRYPEFIDDVIFTACENYEARLVVGGKYIVEIEHLDDESFTTYLQEAK